MKFLVFNLAVAAALVFLFTADRSDIEKMAGQLHDAASDAKAYAKRTLDKGERVLDSGPAKPLTPPPALRQAAPVKPTAAVTPEKPHPVPTPPTTRQSTRVAETMPAAPAPPVPSLTPDVAPDVAQRRREVLSGIPPAEPTTTTPRLKDGTRLMTSADRRKELLSLAEEMELLYARSISR